MLEGGSRISFSAWLSAFLAACAPASLSQSTTETDVIAVNDYDELYRTPVGSRVQFNGYFQEGHEVGGIYLDYADYSAINSRCVAVTDLPRYRRFLDGRRYLVRGTLVNNPCSAEGYVCRTACDTFKVTLETVIEDGDTVSEH